MAECWYFGEVNGVAGGDCNDRSSGVTMLLVVVEKVV